MSDRPEHQADRSIAVVCGDITAALNRRRELMEECVKSTGCKPLFVCAPADHQYIEQIERIGFRCRVIENDKQSLHPLSAFAYFRAVYRILAEERPDEVFVFHLLSIVATARACGRLGIRCHALFAGLGYIFSDQQSWKRGAAKALTVLLMRSCLKRATTVFFQNPDDCQTLRDSNVLAPKTNVVVVNGSGVSLERFQQSEPQIDGPVVFLLVSRILRDKGIPEYYQAAKELRRKYGSEVRVQLLGPFDRNPNSMSPEQIQAWHDEGTIEYLGVTDDVRPFLRNMSVFTLPSFYMEGTPKTILESLAVGRPIITTTSRGCREPVNDGENGILVAPKNVEELVKAMEFFVINRSEISKMGQRSRELARDKYDVRKVNRQMLEEMNWVQRSAG